MSEIAPETIRAPDCERPGPDLFRRERRPLAEPKLVQSIGHLFKFQFEKTSAEIVDKVKEKLAYLEGKITERQARIVKLREEYGITDPILIDLLTQARAAVKRNEPRMNYTVQSVILSNIRETIQAHQQAAAHEQTQDLIIGAGVVNNLLTESDCIEAERMQVQRLELIARNLRDHPDPNIHTLTPGVDRPLRGHVLSYEEMEFLGF